jgi:hypothetical protein
MKTQIQINPDDRDFPIEDDSQEYSERWQYRYKPIFPLFITDDDTQLFDDDDT